MWTIWLWVILAISTFTRICVGHPSAAVASRRENTKIPNGYIPECEMICKKYSMASSDGYFEKPNGGLSTFIHMCDITTSINATSCVIDMFDLLQTLHNESNDVIFFQSLTCHSNHLFRTEITNMQNISYLHVTGFLHIKMCSVSWQDIDLYGRALTLIQLEFTDNTNVWQTEAKSPFWTEYTNHAASQIKNSDNETRFAPEIPLGLGQIGSFGQYCIGSICRIPNIFQDFLWPLMAELRITSEHSADISASDVSDLQWTLPRLQGLEITNCGLKQPIPNFPWDGNDLELPNNISRTKVGNDGYGNQIGITIMGHLYKKVILLDSNNITDLSEYQFTGRLKKISLKQNGLVQISQDTFKNVTNLQALDLSNNKLTELPSTVFAGLTSLLKLIISGNDICQIPKALFHDLKRLRQLDLSGNALVSISDGLLNNLISLKTLNMSSNRINKVGTQDENALARELSFISLSDNNITHIPPFLLWFKGRRNIDLSHNMITSQSLRNVSQYWGLRHITLSNGKSNSQTKNPCLSSELDLSYNQISELSFDDNNNESTISLITMLNFINVNMKNNLLICDCLMYSFYQYIHMKHPMQTPHAYIKIENNQYYKTSLQCAAPFNLKGKALYHLHKEDFSCPRRVQNCPEKCKCRVRASDERVLVNCSYGNLSEIPRSFPQNTTEVDLSHNEISVLSEDVIRSLNSSKIEKLRLHKNKLCVIPRAIEWLRNIEMTLGSNPWECSCKTIWMHHWVSKKWSMIRDLDDVLCYSPSSAAGKVIIEAEPEDFICITPAHIILIRYLVGTGVIMLLVLIGITVIYKYRGELKVLMYVHFNWHPFDHAEKADVLDTEYDVFISYSGLDYKWVCFDLLKKLEEHDPPYKVCVHDRDFMPGAYIEDNIMEAIQMSRRMILVLSNNYLKSDWCMLEFRAAHTKVLNDRTNYLILVLYDDVDIEKLDPDLQLYIRTNTYLSIKHKRFYDKLFYSLPTKTLSTLQDDLDKKLKESGNESEGSSLSSINSRRSVMTI